MNPLRRGFLMGATRTQNAEARKTYIIFEYLTKNSIKAFIIRIASQTRVLPDTPKLVPVPKGFFKLLSLLSFIEDKVAELLLI